MLYTAVTFLTITELCKRCSPSDLYHVSVYDALDTYDAITLCLIIQVNKMVKANKPFQGRMVEYPYSISKTMLHSESRYEIKKELHIFFLHQNFILAILVSSMFIMTPGDVISIIF